MQWDEHSSFRIHPSSFSSPHFPVYLGIEIGGTKLQLGVGSGDGTLVAIERLDIDPAQGASGIRQQIAELGPMLVARHGVQRVGIGFGGPVDMARGHTIKSHQIDGWHDFPLAAWSQSTLGIPAVIGNDADVAALAEARFGAGRGRNPVFYVTVGSGVGGGLVVDGRIYRGRGLGATEIGHLRPGLHADRPEQTVESLASGWGIAATAQARLSHLAHQVHRLPTDVRDREQLQNHLAAEQEAEDEFAHDLLLRCDHDLDALSAKLIAQAAAEGNGLATEIWQQACTALGWAIAQVITLTAPEIIVIGGGVALAGRTLFYEPVEQAVARYVFPAFLDQYTIAPAELGEAMVVHGAIALASE